jgi:hypothetical protein
MSETVGVNEYKFDTTGSVRARVGYAFDHALLYGAAGWTGARGHVDTPIGSDSATFSGWTVGAGVDYAFTDNVFGRLEYRYNDYGSKDLMGVDTDFNQNVVGVGIGCQILTAADEATHLNERAESPDGPGLFAFQRSAEECQSNRACSLVSTGSVVVEPKRAGRIQWQISILLT